jgi:hypothetical protein
MSDPHHASTGTVGDPFTPDRIAAYQADDRGAGRAIVLLMVCVFSLGLINFLTITIIVGRG